MTGEKRVYASIDLAAVEHNFKQMKRQLRDGAKICAVIKADGYGHGAAAIARQVEKMADLWGFAVATVTEAVKLREAGIKKPLLILGYVFPEDYEVLAELSIRPAVFTMEMAEQLSETVMRSGRKKPLPIHIAVDTGMNRIGFLPSPEAADAVVHISRMEGLCIEGMFTHFARADEADKSDARRAFSEFLSFAEAVRALGISIPILHAANSAGILELPEAHLDMVRAGISIYGIYPSEQMRRDKDLRPVMELKSHVAHVKEIPAGEGISYGATFVTARTTKVATIPVGYGDGYPRSLSGRGYLLVGGRKAPILGRVCMDQFMVDVTGMDVKTGDEVTLMGRDGGAFLSVEELAALSGRFPYEFVCDIGARVPRICRFLDEPGL